jgi:hypothetical protein
MHDLWRAVQPSLVHVHRDERMEERGVGGRRPFHIRREWLYCVKAKTALRGEAASDRRLAATAAPTDESNVAKPLRERLDPVDQVDATERGQCRES